MSKLIPSSTGSLSMKDVSDFVGSTNQQIMSAAIGVQFEPYPAVNANNSAAPTTQTLWGVAIVGRVGAYITGIKTRVGVAAAGTTPTTARFGLATKAGVMVALSANVNATANWATGVNAIPFATPYTIPTTDVYLACFVVDGTWGSTQPLPVLISATTAPSQVADGTNVPLSFSWTGQTDLPAVGSPLTLTTGATRAYYLALY